MAINLGRYEGFQEEPPLFDRLQQLRDQANPELGGGDFVPADPGAGPAPPEPVLPPGGGGGGRPQRATPPPQAGGTDATPVQAGTFALPGTAQGAPFRTQDFFSNRFVSGNAVEDERPIGSTPGGGSLAGGDAAQLGEDELRRIFSSILGRG